MNENMNQYRVGNVDKKTPEEMAKIKRDAETRGQANAGPSSTHEDR